MRVIAEVQQSNLSTILDQHTSDRHVPIATFIPISEDFSSFFLVAVQLVYVEWMKIYLHSYLDASYRATAQQAYLAGGSVIERLIEAKARQYNQKEQAQVAQCLTLVDDSKTVGQLSNVIKSFKQSHDFTAIDTKARAGAAQVYRQASVWTLLGNLYQYPVGTPDTTSELGYLFLDRTRIRPSGFILGEHIYCLSLAPGEEVTLEQRSYFKETSTFEETLEREYEEKLETETETTARQQQTGTEETTEQATTNLGGDLSAGGSVPTKYVTVNADVGVDASHTFSNARTVSDQLSQETAQRQTENVSSRLRSLHRTQFKVVREAGFETRSQRIIRNPNVATSLSLHYFKIMQRLALRQERRGICLCWAPFIRDPGASLRVRMELARDQVYQEAEQRLDLPAEPMPPTKDYVREWVKGETAEILTSPPIGFSNLLTHLLFMRVKVPTGATFTGSLRVMLDGPTAGASHAVVDHSQAHGGPDEDGYISAPVSVKTAWNAVPTNLFVTIEAEVRRIPDSYDQKHEAYLERLSRWNEDVSEIISRARVEARPQANAAALRVLSQADVRTELLDAVIKQHIALAQRDEAFEVELWHRLLDLENISLTLYPGWWNEEPMPYPALRPDHFLNASWARVFLPVRHLPKAAPGKTNEEKFLYQLYKPDRQAGTISTAAYNQFVDKVLKDLKKEQDKFLDSHGRPVVQEIGKEWEVTVPTDGTHVEAVLGATTAADLITERRVEASVKLIETEVSNNEADAAIKSRVVDPVSGKVLVGHNGEQ